MLSLLCSHKLLNLCNQLNRVNLAKASECSIRCVSTHANNPSYAPDSAGKLETTILLQVVQ